MTTSITFTRAKFLRLKKEYTKAVREGMCCLTFDGQVIITDCAKSMIQYLDSQFKKAKGGTYDA